MRPKDIGTAAETAVVKYLRNHGFAGAERRALAGTFDLGDIVGIVGVCVEVKGGKAAESAGDGQVAQWLDETERERVNAGADIGLLVMKRKGVGSENAGRWWAVLRLRDLTSYLAHDDGPTPDLSGPVRLLLADAVLLLRALGYGDPLTTPSLTGDSA